jgi:GTPase Era involved in 16S rRNA processing
VAIVGAQNSGKSTLLNNLFGTNFKMLNGIAGHRTTRGVILGRDKESSLIIMDVEGNDSYESHLEGDDVPLLPVRITKGWWEASHWLAPISS